ISSASTPELLGLDRPDVEEIVALEVVGRLLVEVELAALVAHLGAGEHQELSDVDAAVALEVALAGQTLQEVCGDEPVLAAVGIAPAIAVERQAARTGEDEAAGLVADAARHRLVARLLVDRVAGGERRREAGVEDEQQITLDLGEKRQHLC